MNGIVDMLKTSWQVMGGQARRKFLRYLVFTLVTDAIASVALIVLSVMDALGVNPFGQLDILQAFNLIIGLYLFLFIFLIVTAIFIAGAYKAIKRDYFARNFAGETFVEQNHWSKKDAFMLYGGLVGLVAFIPNIVSLLVELIPPIDPDVTSIITGIVWIGIAVYAVPRCCERYLSPGPQLSGGSSLSVTPGASGAANPTDGDRQ